MSVQRIFGTILALSFVFAASAQAVTSVMTRHNSSGDFLKGETEDTLIGSGGTIRLSPKTETIDTGDLLKDVWSIHSMMTDADGAVYLGTGPDAKVLRYAGGAVKQVYPVRVPLDEGAILNEHVFAMGKDLAGRLLVGVSGEKGRLVRLAKESEVVFEDEKVQYIFAIALDADNNVYLGTGPEGLVYRLDAFCKNPEVIYDAKDKNILSLIVRGGIVYAGGDERGLVYKIDPTAKRATVLYDSDQNEISSLLMDDEGNVYAAATSAAAAAAQLKVKGVSMKDAPGRPDTDGAKGTSEAASSLNTANENASKKKQPAKPAPQAPKPPAAKAAGHIYKISPDGFVTDVFSEVAVFYSLIEFDGKLWLGTGNDGQLFTVETATEERAVCYDDDTSSQITSLLSVGETVYLGLSNPARLMKMDKGFVSRGVYTSDLIDAGQPARWGKLQLEAAIPDGCEVLMASRSGNVREPNDPTFSDWTADVPVMEATDLNCPLGRFCQYRLMLTSADVSVTPEIREVAAASMVPNLAPRINSVQTRRSGDPKKPYVQEVGFSASDNNKDELEFTLEIRKLGRTVWIPLEDELDKTRFEWDGRTLEDGRYEIRVTTSDHKSNSTATALTGSRVSDAFVIDNTAPAIASTAVKVAGDTATLTFLADDTFTVIGKVRFTVDSNEQWTTLLPDDMVSDTRSERFTVVIDDLAAGEHVIAVAVSDDLGNTRYQTFEVTVE